MDNRPIGVFDSGVGGMAVLKELKKSMPQESFVYLGDTKRFPYGSKSKQTIIELTKNGVEFLISKNVKLIVIACGTATSQALEEIKKIYPIPIIGVLEPTAKYLQAKQKRQIGVIATAGTIRSKGWETILLEKIPDANLQTIACPLLAQLVEEGWAEGEIADLVVKEYLKPLEKIEALILGCTHYPLLINSIQKQVGKEVEIINIGVHTATEVQKLLKEKELGAKETISKLEVYLTETECKFNNVASMLLGKEIQAKLVEEETEFI